jgi:hypothetical protein
MIEMLVFKCGDSYLRICEGEVNLTSLFKATVYPKEPGGELEEHRTVVEDSYPQARLKLLRLEEFDYPEGAGS